MRGWEKVAAGNEEFAFVAILYTGVTDNKCGLSLAQRRALFVGIMNSIDKGYNPLVYCSSLRRGWIMPYAPLGLGVGIMAMPAMTACVGYSHIGISHKGVLSANAMSKVLTEICIPVKGVANRCVCLSLLPKLALLRCMDMKMCEYEGW